MHQSNIESFWHWSYWFCFWPSCSNTWRHSARASDFPQVQVTGQWSAATTNALAAHAIQKYISVFRHDNWSLMMMMMMIMKMKMKMIPIPVVWTCPWIPSRAHSATCAEVLTSLISPMCSSSQSQPSSLFHDDPGGAPTLIENMQHISVVSSASYLEMTWNATLHSLGVWTGVMYNQSFATKRSVLKAYGAYPWIEFQRCSMMFHYFHCASQPAAVQQDVGGFDVPVEGFWLWIVHVGEAWRTRERFSKRACQGIAM